MMRSFAIDEPGSSVRALYATLPTESYTNISKLNASKRVLNCNSCWQLVAQATYGTEAHMNMHGPHGCRWCAPISKVHTPQPPCAHILLKCTPISKVQSTLHTHIQSAHPSDPICLLLPDCFTLAAHEFQSDASAYCLLLTLVDVCGTNTPVILLSENVFLPELH